MVINQEKLFFIIAPPRSGTTLLQDLMNTFSGFCNTEESRISGKNSPFCWRYVLEYNDFSYLEKFIEDHWSKEFFVEKSPPSINCLEQTLERFPDANYIFLERNPEKIIKSIFNLRLEHSKLGSRKIDLANSMDDDVNLLRFEELKTKRLLEMIKKQVENKPNFKNQVTIRYEHLVDSLDFNLSLLSKTFGIEPDIKKAHQCLDRPSHSSKFRYGYDTISSKKAKAMMKISCALWNYT